MRDSDKGQSEFPSELVNKRLFVYCRNKYTFKEDLESRGYDAEKFAVAMFKDDARAKRMLDTLLCDFEYKYYENGKLIAHGSVDIPKKLLVDETRFRCNGRVKVGEIMKEDLPFNPYEAFRTWAQMEPLFDHIGGDYYQLSIETCPYVLEFGVYF